MLIISAIRLPRSRKTTAPFISGPQTLPARKTDRPEKEKEAGGSQSVLLTTNGGSRTSIGTVIHFADESAELDEEAHRRFRTSRPCWSASRKRSSSAAIRRGGRCPKAARSRTIGTFRTSAVWPSWRTWKSSASRERIRLSQAAGFEPVATPKENFPGGGYSRVEVSLLNETTGAKVAEHGAASKPRVKVTEAKHEALMGTSPERGGRPALSDCRPSRLLRLEVNRKQLLPGDVVQFGRQHFAGGRDLQRAEELIALAGRSVALQALRDAQELELRAERRIELAGTKCSGMGRAGDELPERA